LCFRRTEHAELGGGKGRRRSAQKAAPVMLDFFELRWVSKPVSAAHSCAAGPVS